MTYTVKLRTIPGGPVLAEYLCPEHGRFEAIVTRGESGDPPAEQPCPAPLEVHPGLGVIRRYSSADAFLAIAEHELAAAEAMAAECDAIAATGLYCPTEEEIAPHRWTTCALPSPWTISAPTPLKDSVPCSAVQRGGDTERRPGMLDTRPLAEGMPLKEWRKKQDAARQERRHQQLIAKGLKTKRVQV